MKLKDLLKEVQNESRIDMKLPVDKPMILQADSDKYDRGLIITWRSDGGYDVQYWYEDPDNIVEAEIKGDGQSFGYVRDVFVGYHPELGDKFKGEDDS